MNTIVGIPVYAPGSPVYNPNSVSSSSDGSVPPPPSDGSLPPPPPGSYSDSSLESISNIEEPTNTIANDSSNEKRSDGIELIINENKQNTDKKEEGTEGETSDSTDKKSISFN
jgi:hypothetical protein